MNADGRGQSGQSRTTAEQQKKSLLGTRAGAVAEGERVLLGIGNPRRVGPALG
jgi:hypothetical protein